MQLQIVPFVDHEIGYRLLQKLILLVKSGDITIPAVITTEDNEKGWWPSVVDLCLTQNIPLIKYHQTLIGHELIRHADWYFLLSWKHILSTELINIPKNGTINLHYSLLPDFRGVYPVNWAIIKGQTISGFTYHFVNEKIDGGEIFMQVEVPIKQNDTSKSLLSKIDNAVCIHFQEFIERIINFEENSCPEKISRNAINSKSYFSRNDFEKECFIDLNKTYRGYEFLNLLRGLTFSSNSKNAYILDHDSGGKIYLNIEMNEE